MWNSNLPKRPSPFGTPSLYLIHLIYYLPFITKEIEAQGCEMPFSVTKLNKSLNLNQILCYHTSGNWMWIRLFYCYWVEQEKYRAQDKYKRVWEQRWRENKGKELRQEPIRQDRVESERRKDWRR